MNHPTDRITHTTAFVTPVVEHWLEREIAPWVRSMKDRSDDPSHHERMLLPRSYISLRDEKNAVVKLCVKELLYLSPCVSTRWSKRCCVTVGQPASRLTGNRWRTAISSYSHTYTHSLCYSEVSCCKTGSQNKKI